MNARKLLAIVLTLAAAAPWSAPSASAGGEETRWTVLFHEGVPADAVEKLARAGARFVRADATLGFVVAMGPSDLDRRLASDALVKLVERAGEVRALDESVTPNDPRYGDQYALPAIRASEAWGFGLGSASVRVAVLDSGVDTSHADLAQRLERDANGHYGWNFLNDTPHVRDDYGHGTHVTGILAAATNNAVGVAGVAQASVVTVKVLDEEGVGTWDAVASGIRYATDRGARVISLSLGGASESAAVSSAIGYARAHGAILVAASGNSGGAVDFPARDERVIAVAALDDRGATPSFSARGPEVDLAAPGVNVLSTSPTYDVTLDLPLDYAEMTGTSQAAPHVAGVAALVLSRNAALLPADVMSILNATATDLGSVGHDILTGWGRLHAASAVSSATGPINHAPAGAVVTGPIVVTRGVPSSFNASAVDPENDAVRVRLEWGDGTSETRDGASGETHVFTHAWTSPGEVCVRARGVDSRGATGDWSACRNVLVNDPPPRPEPPVGLPVAAEDTLTLFLGRGDDPEGEPVHVRFDWGDGTSERVGPSASGNPIPATHAFAAPGPYCVTVTTEDVHGALSPPSACAWITIPQVTA